MKISFTDDEAAKLDGLIQAMLPKLRVHSDTDGGATLRLVKKMQYKFAPSGAGSVVFLGRKERDLINSLVSVGLNLTTIPMLETTLKSIKEKVSS